MGLSASERLRGPLGVRQRWRGPAPVTPRLAEFASSGEQGQSSRYSSFCFEKYFFMEIFFCVGP